VKPLPLVIRPEQRFSCHACGVCCREFTVALDAGEAERIARHDWAREGERFREPFARPGTGPWGEPRDELRRREDGRCIFLDEDGLCLVEKRLGRAAKPRTCRKFPFEFVAAPDGVRAVVSLECASRWRSAGGGAPVEGARRDLEALLASSEPYRTAWRVRVAPDGLLLAPEAYLALERDLLAAVDAGAREGPGALQPALAALARAVARARGAAPEPGAFDAALARAIEKIRRVTEARSDVARGLGALGRAPDAWRGPLDAASATAAGAALMRLALRTWVEAAIPGRSATAEEGVGWMILGSLLAAAIGANLSRGAPSAADLNMGAREASIFFRGRNAAPLKGAAAEFCALCRAAAAL
jgi:Fe-S-cluster containining protein